ncbi:hypothetical protein FDECE_14050 [Fusarium decemcellulare]|nr:hypothetical protein FDECE_14050 [Fusarium decemcellulare]
MPASHVLEQLKKIPPGQTTNATDQPALADPTVPYLHTDATRTIARPAVSTVVGRLDVAVDPERWCVAVLPPTSCGAPLWRPTLPVLPTSVPLRSVESLTSLASLGSFKVNPQTWHQQPLPRVATSARSIDSFFLQLATGRSFFDSFPLPNLALWNVKDTETEQITDVGGSFCLASSTPLYQQASACTTPSAAAGHIHGHGPRSGVSKHPWWNDSAFHSLEQDSDLDVLRRRFAGKG